MKLLKWLWSLIKLPWTLTTFVYHDLKTDIQFIIKAFKRGSKGEEIFDPGKMEAIKKEFTTGWNVKWFMRSVPFFLMIILAFIVGYNYAGFKCNNFIYENYGDQIVRNFTESALNAFNYTLSKISS